MSIAKIDLDVKLEPYLLLKYIATRKAIVETLGYTWEDFNVAETNKGYHIWIRIAEKLSDEELAELQFLLGDDQKRCKFNFLRLEGGAFRRFNALFSKKAKRR